MTPWAISSQKYHFCYLRQTTQPAYDEVFPTVPAGCMSDLAAPSAPSLRAIFAGEARVHMAALDAGLAALARGAAPHARDAMLDALHTLAGAARAVDLRELEWLSQALERVIGAAAKANAELSAPRRALLAEAVALAHQLLGGAGEHSGKRPLTLVAQLDALARELAVVTPCNRSPEHRTATP
jgi:chemotaxis protein histidine kinase CheA